MNIYDEIMKLVRINEGGYSNHPVDKGGPTMYGITQGVYNSYRRAKNLLFKDVRFIENYEVNEIYYKKYWLASKSNLMEFPLATVHMDTAINFGVTGAAKMLQALLGVKVDGILGVKTMSALQEHNQYDLALEYCEFRKERRHNIVKKNPSQGVFLRGWLNRDNRVKEFIKNNNR